jgi:hypothetical protein
VLWRRRGQTLRRMKVDAELSPLSEGSLEIDKHHGIPELHFVSRNTFSSESLCALLSVQQLIPRLLLLVI